MKTIEYTEDFNGWVFEQARLLKTGALEQLDIDNLVEELEDMGRNDHRAIKSHFITLIQHLLKYEYQPEKRSKSWKTTIKNERVHILELLEESPSLKHYMDKEEFLPMVWRHGVSEASKETNIDEENFPQEPSWTVEQIRNPDFLPS